MAFFDDFPSYFRPFFAHAQSVVNFRLDDIYRPGDDFFLIYNELGTVADGTVAGQRNRSIIATITHCRDVQFRGR
jgi:hypothetical protein